MTNLDSILKSKVVTLPVKVCLVKAVIFPVVMYRCESCTIKKAESGRIDAFELWCWRRLLRVPWAARRSNQSILKEINPKYFLRGLMLRLKLQYLGHLMWRANSFEKTLMLGKIEGRRRRDNGGWAGWMASLTWWTWKWKWKCESLIHVWLLATPWAVALQAPLSMEFSGQEYWSGLPFPSAGVIPDPGIELRSPTLQADSLHLSHLGSCEFEQTRGDTEGHRNVVCSSPWGRKEWDKT